MAQIDDLKLAIQAVSDGVAGVDLKLDEVLASVQAVIDLLKSENPDLSEAIAQLQAVAAQAGSVQAEAQAIKDAADAALPPTP